MPEVSIDLLVEEWLDSTRISRVIEWDVLVFLYRHGISILSAEQISLLLGYRKSDVGKSLDSLSSLGFVQRSRSSQGMRIYRFIDPSEGSAKRGLGQLLNLSETRQGRLMVAKILRKRTRVNQLTPFPGITVLRRKKEEGQRG